MLRRTSLAGWAWQSDWLRRVCVRGYHPRCWRACGGGWKHASGSFAATLPFFACPSPLTCTYLKTTNLGMVHLFGSLVGVSNVPQPGNTLAHTCSSQHQAHGQPSPRHNSSPSSEATSSPSHNLERAASHPCCVDPFRLLLLTAAQSACSYR